MIPVLHKETYFRDFGLALTRCISDSDHPLHKHDFSEIVIITHGHGLHITDNETWPVAAGDVFVITGSRTHGYSEAGRMGLVNVLYDTGELAIPQKDLQSIPGYTSLFTLEPGWRRRHQFKSRLRLSIQQLTHAGSIIDELASELKNRTPGFQLMAKAAFMRLVGFLSRAYSEIRTDAPRELFRIAEAISFIENNYDREVYLEKVAGIARMSKRNFLRVFNEAMGVSPMAHLVSIRVARAGELLRKPELTVTEIGFKVGFADSNYFARQFRKLTGLTPSEYRRSNSPAGIRPQA